MQAQLRTQLLEKLQQGCGGSVLTLQHGHPKSLWQQALACIVAEYLTSNQFLYTLSVFQAESGLNNGMPLSRPELLNVLEIQAKSPLGRTIELLCTDSEGKLSLWFKGTISRCLLKVVRCIALVRSGVLGLVGLVCPHSN